MAKNDAATRAIGDSAKGGRVDTRSPRATFAQIAVSALFQAIVPLLCHVRIHRDARVVLGRRTLAVINHKSDLDIPVLVRTIYGPSIWPRWTGRITFVGRSDLFLRGFLALRFAQLGPLRRWLFPVDLTPILRTLRIIPVGKAGPRLVAEWIAELKAVYGPDRPLGDLLSPCGLERATAAGVSPSLTLAQAASWRYRSFLEQDAGSELIDERTSRHLRLAEARGARARLAEIVAALEGGVLTMAPEGDLSPDGRLQPFRSGVYRVLKSVPDACVLPAGITYDLLCDGRPPTFVRVGRPLTGLAALGRRACEARVRQAFATLATVTLAQLVGYVVFEELGPTTPVVSKAELAQRVCRLAAELARAGRPMDPRLRDPQAFRQRFAELLRNARGHGLEQDDAVLRLDWNLLQSPVNGPLQNPLVYAYNELCSASPPAAAHPARRTGPA